MPGVPKRGIVGKRCYARGVMHCAIIVGGFVDALNAINMV